MNVLIIGYVWPETKSSAAGWHMLSLIRLFREQGWQVTFASPAQKTDHMDDLSLWNVVTKTIELNCSSFDEFVADLNPDMVVFDRFMMEEQFGWRVAQQCPNAIRVLDSEDFHSLRQARHSLFKESQKKHRKENSVPTSQFIGELFSTMSELESTHREVAAIFRSDLSLIISDFEQSLLENQFSVPSDSLHHLPFIVDYDVVKSNHMTPFSERKHFVVIGNFRHAPNWDSVLWLKESIWSGIRKQLPDAELHIYGSYTPPKATALHNPKQGFYIKGWAESVEKVMSEARVCLAPLRFGAGIKGKLLDAMRCGTPSVTTTIGVEGMISEDHMGDWPGSVEDSEALYIDAAVSLYRNEAIWLAKHQLGLPLLKERYNKDLLSRRLLERLISLKDNLHEHRKQNFIGSMLQLHNQKSTQYMSQWIEVKNKLQSIEQE